MSTRRRLTRAWPVALILTLAACAPAAEKHWTRPDTTSDDFARDSRLCEATATRVYGGSGGFHPFASFRNSGRHADVSPDAYRSCMHARGYQRVEGGQWIGVSD